MATVPSTAVNHWRDPSCARAFWAQHDLPPYRRLLRDTVEWLEPRPGDRWLDLGCGCGQLTQALWEKSEGRVAEVVALDCAAENARALARLRREARPAASEDRIRFVCADFSEGLAAWETARFDGAVSGLAIQYAESYCEARRAWTTDAYDHLLAEIRRVLRPEGTFVFSVNVPEPAWGRVALGGVRGVFQARHPGRFLTRSWRMMRYGAWLKQEARLGRFHYLALPTLVQKLSDAGFVAIEHRLTYARQAYLIRCRKPA